MNKDQLIDQIVNKTGYSKNQVKEYLEGILDIIVEQLKKGERVNLVGFGNFQVVKRKGRKGVNPQTGREMKIPTVKIAKFRPGKKLKEAVK